MRWTAKAPSGLPRPRGPSWSAIPAAEFRWNSRSESSTPSSAPNAQREPAWGSPSPAISCASRPAPSPPTPNPAGAQDSPCSSAKAECTAGDLVAGAFCRTLLHSHLGMLSRINALTRKLPAIPHLAAALKNIRARLHHQLRQPQPGIGPLKSPSDGIIDFGSGKHDVFTLDVSTVERSVRPHIGQQRRPRTRCRQNSIRGNGAAEPRQSIQLSLDLIGRLPPRQMNGRRPLKRPLAELAFEPRQTHVHPIPDHARAKIGETAAAQIEPARLNSAVGSHVTQPVGLRNAPEAKSIGQEIPAPERGHQQLLEFRTARLRNRNPKLVRARRKTVIPILRLRRDTADRKIDMLQRQPRAIDRRIRRNHMQRLGECFERNLRVHQVQISTPACT